uniref:RNA-directed DNA polymerase, eukaryota n=1 Tax=Tanacetum cinerariifolium TaxID=118510 RepID=A0A699GYX6_TANCI|nr:RNA-directed DNA polymerase, eukaryota [Tanacetum cinerariifolium]
MKNNESSMLKPLPRVPNPLPRTLKTKWYSNKSKEDHTQQISKSIFVMNSPDHFLSRDLWKNLCTIWIDHLRLHAPVVRFQRDPNLMIGNLEGRTRGLPWGELVEMKNSGDVSFSCKQLCVRTRFEDLNSERFKVIVQGKVLWIRAKELETWGLESGVKEQENLFDDDNHVEKVVETSFKNKNVSMHGNKNIPTDEQLHSDVPFQIYDILKKNKDHVGHSTEEELQYPQAICFERHLSDHRLILMRELDTDYGASLFWVFHSWFNMYRFDKLVEVSWKNSNVSETNGILFLKKKLQIIKNDIKLWFKETRKKSSDAKLSIQNKLDVDKVLDQGGFNEATLRYHFTPLKDLQDNNSIEALDIAQKVKVCWSIDGDENSKYFHGILSKKDLNLLFVDSC